MRFSCRTRHRAAVVSLSILISSGGLPALASPGLGVFSDTGLWRATISALAARLHDLAAAVGPTTPSVEAAPSWPVNTSSTPVRESADSSGVDATGESTTSGQPVDTVSGGREGGNGDEGAGPWPLV